MAQTPGTFGNGQLTRLVRFSGQIASAGAAQLILPPQPRTYLIIQNTSATELRLGVGPATATAALSGTSVSTITVTNAGMGYTKPPIVRILGGVGGGLGFDNPPNPANVATAHAVLSGATIGSIVVDNAGSGYTAVPYVYLENHPDDSTGSMAPAVATGFQILAAGAFVQETGTISTDAISIWGATLAQTFECYIVPAFRL